ncbi:MAG: acetylxylan esterase [Phycisphaeraceae bacterium]|nr:acetylxylan esterase [Phycisphaeraceae bacterium]MCW5763199.1 acetylxylan esterase [Phycisphaeraceae bacterium]
MIEPDDYGMGAEEALARVGDPTRAMLHKPFWNQWWKAVIASRPVLRERATPDPSDPGATHEFESYHHVRIGCRLVLPQQPPRGGVVILHGYEDVPTLAEQAREEMDLVTEGLAVLLVRVRGFAGSRLDTPGIPPGGGGGASGWITCGLDDPADGLSGAASWVLPHAAADVVDACRALRNYLIEHATPDAELFLKGHCLGATLAIIATAKLMGQLPHESIVERLVVALPTLADWSWRQLHRAPSRGTGAEIEALLRAHASRRDLLLDRLRLADPVIHAQNVRCRVLCMLAERDDVAPAPAAAAVYNALGSDIGRKWRFVVPFGHCDGGIINARRHALFERCTRDFLNPARKPRQSMLAWEPLLRRGQRPPTNREET